MDRRCWVRRSGGVNFPRCGAPRSCSFRTVSLTVAPGVVERRNVALRSAGPGHRPAGGKGPLPHLVALFIVRQEPSNLCSYGLCVGEGHKDSATIR